MTDARFEDSHEGPLNLGALDGEDLTVLSALVQDAVFPVTEMRWDSPSRRFVLLLNRFRWEEGPARAASPERVQSILVFEGVTGVSSTGIDRMDRQTILSLLSITFEPGEAPSGNVILTLAGDGALRLSVEALEATLKDVTKPYVAPSKKTPDHPD